MSDANGIINQYEKKISGAIAALGAPKDGNVWLYRVEHLRDVPENEINTDHYTPEQVETLKDAKGRWFGDDLAVRFEHMYRYVKTEPHDGVENIRLSAVQVPLDVAAACYLGNVDAPQGEWQDMTKLQRGRSATNTPEQEYFFPQDLHANDLGGDKAALDRARECNRVLGNLEKLKQPLCEIPLDDYLAASPEAWRDLGEKLDNQHGTHNTRDAVLFYNPATRQRAAGK